MKKIFWRIKIKKGVRKGSEKGCEFGIKIPVFHTSDIIKLYISYKVKRNLKPIRHLYNPFVFVYFFDGTDNFFIKATRPTLVRFKILNCH